MAISPRKVCRVSSSRKKNTFSGYSRSRRLRLESLERRQLLTATIGTELASVPGIEGPFLETPAQELAEIEFHEEHNHDHDDVDFALPGVGESAGATNTGDGSIGAVGLIPTALYDPSNLPLSDAGLPELSSLPGASTAVYIDFDGWTTFDPFDVDGNPETFNNTEQQRIWETWRQVAAYLSPFDANVTTVAPDFDNIATNYELVSNSVSGGYSFLRFPSSRPYGFNTSSNAPNRSSGIIHEIGHNYGLRHQGDFDEQGEKTREYSRGYGDLEAPTLGVDFAGRMHRMFIGHSRNASDLQDDIAHIQGRIMEHTTNGGDGFRGDDHGATTLDATALESSGVIQIGSGIIERMDDVDAFTFTVDGTVNVLVRPERSSPVDVMLEVYDSSGTLIASGDQFELFDQLAIETSVPETLTLLVRSHGDYGELGSYEIFVQPQYDGLQYRDLVDTHNYKNGQLQNRRADATFDDSTGIYQVRAASGDIWGSQDDMTFVSRKLAGDGQITTRVTANNATNAWSKAGVMIRESTARNSKHAFVAVTGNNGIAAQARMSTGNSSVNTNTADGNRLGDYVRLTRTGDVFVSDYSTDGVVWTTLETRSIAMDIEVEIGLAFANQSTGTPHIAEFDNLQIVGDRELPNLAALDAVANVVLTPEVETDLTVSWDSVIGAEQYEILTSLDGFQWASAAVVAGAATSRTLSGLDQDRRHFVVVHALDASGNRGPSSERVHADTRPGQVTGLRVSAFDEDEVVLDWHEANGEIGYRIERSDGSGGWTTVGEVGAAVPSYTDSELQPDTEYTYRVVTLDALGDAAVTSGVTGQTKLGPLQGLTATNLADGSVELNWSNDYNTATGILVERRIELGEWETVGNLPADASSFTDLNPEFGYSQYRAGPVHPVITTTPSEISHWVPGLEARFFLDDTGETLIDSGNAKADVAISETNLVREIGRLSGGASFNGSDAVIDLGHTAGLHGPTDFSVGMWTRSIGSDASVLVAQGGIGSGDAGGSTGGSGALSPTSGGFSLMLDDDGQLSFQVPGERAPQSGVVEPGLELTSARAINDGFWHYVVATRSGNEGTLWVDGRVVDTGTADAIDLSVFLTTTIGANSGGASLQYGGMMDDIRIVDYAISQTEIQATIDAANLPPTSTAQTYDLVIDEDAPVSVPWDSFASDPDGDLLVAAATSPPLHGELQIASDGGWMYVPNENFFGEDSFVFLPEDTFGATASELVTVNVTVNSVNDAPKLSPLDYIVPQGASLFTIDWLSNTVDAEGDPLALTIDSQPAIGDVSIRDGFLDYGVVGGDFAGTAAFSITLSDNLGASETSLITLRSEDIVHRFQFDELGGPVTADSVSPNGDAMVNGAARVSGRQGFGAFRFDGVDDQLASNANLNQTLGGTATLIFWIKTAQTGTSAAWNSPGVTGIEQAGGSNDIQWGWLDGSGRIGVRPGTGGAKSSSAINDDQWHHVALTRDSASGVTQVFVDGELTGSGTGPTGFKSLEYNQIGVIADTGGSPRFLDGSLDDLRVYRTVLDATEVASIYQTSSADRPSGISDTATTDEDVPIEIDVLGNDGNAFPVTLAGFASAPASGSVSITATGQVLYTPNPDFNGSDVFEYWVASNGGMLSKAQVDVQVNAVNDKPTSLELTNASLVENTDLSSSGSLVGAFVGEDIDSTSLVYTLVAGDGDTDNVLFELVGTELWMRSGSTVDHESKPQYSIRASVSDGVESYETEIQIDVTDRLETHSIELTPPGEGRSHVDGLTIDFDGPVVASTDAFLVERLGATNLNVEVNVAWSLIEGKSRATLSFSGEHTENSGSLIDGRYQLTLVGDLIQHAVRGDAMDGNFDSVPGGNQLFDDAADRFFRFYGDTDGDYDVDGQDYGRFGLAFLRSVGQAGFNPELDFDRDGDIDGQDYGQFGLRFLKSLP